MESLELKICRQAAAAGAQIAHQYFIDLPHAGIENKASELGYQGIVTKADVEAQEKIIQVIRDAFPDHQFLAEESQTEDSNEQFDTLAQLPKQLWVIDPIDGTNNFAHGISHYAISVAYYRDGVAQCGCIINPESNDEFICERGKGAWHNSQRASVNQHQRLSETILGVGFYYDRGSMMRATLDAIAECFEHRIHGIRRMGTAALDIVYVGLGRFGGFFEFQLAPWDFAAARLFLEEAGGTITTCVGSTLPLAKTSVLATNGRLHRELTSILIRHWQN